MDFEALDGVNASAGHVKRTKEGTGWNSGATSKRAMTKVDDEVAGISADCDQTDKSMMLGLNSGSTNDVDSEIDFGIVCDNGMIRISEHGVVRDEDFGSYYPGETFQVSVLASGVVAYYKDGAQFSTSKHSPAFPLYATVRFNSHGASLSRVNWVKKIVEGGNDLQLVKWTNLRGVTTANKLGYLKRTTGGHGWNEGAYSARAITKVGDEIRGISADCMRRDRRLMFGLSHRPWVNHDFKTIDFAIDCDPGNRWSKPSIYVVESGSRKKTLAPLVPGETAQIALNDDGFIAYYVDGELKYTSTKRPSFPLYADASLGTHHAELANARWVQKIVQGANNLQFMDFEALDGVNASAGHVKRTKEGTGWNSGATSKRAMTKVDDEVAGISADCDQTDKSMMLGLNSGSTNDVDSEIDFGIVCDNGMIRISEHGVVRDEDFGSYYPGETFQVSVLASGVVAYYKDGAQFSTSKHSPAFPLYATVRFNSHGASLSRVNWVKKIVEGGNDLQLVKWTNLRGVTTANKLGYLKRTTGGHGWNEGAYSARAITKVGDEIRGISADCMRRDRRLMFGLSHRPWVNHDFKTIDFAIDCDPGNRWSKPSIYVVESGSRKKTLAPLVPGETAQIALNDDGFIAYYVDGELKYTSTKRPSFPLYADASLGTHHAELANARWIQRVVEGADNLELVEFLLPRGYNSTPGSLAHVTTEEKRQQKIDSKLPAYAASRQSISGFDDARRGVSADCSDNKSQMMFGLLSNDSLPNGTMNFEIYCDSGTLRLIEDGVVIKTISPGPQGPGPQGPGPQGPGPQGPGPQGPGPQGPGPQGPGPQGPGPRGPGPRGPGPQGPGPHGPGPNGPGPRGPGPQGPGPQGPGPQGPGPQGPGPQGPGPRGPGSQSLGSQSLGPQGPGPRGPGPQGPGPHGPGPNGPGPNGPGPNVVPGGFKAPSAYRPGETFSIIMNDQGKIEYLQNGNTLHISDKPINFPLYSQAKIITPGARLTHIHWVEMMDFATVQRAEAYNGTVRRPMPSPQDNAIRSTSSRAVTKLYDEVRGISADCSDTDTNMVFGLSSALYEPSSDNAIEYAIGCDAGIMNIYEDGKLVKTVGSYLQGDSFQVAFNDDGVVHYFKEGDSVYNSSKPPKFPLFADAYVGEHGDGKLENVKWVKKVVKGAFDLQLVKWTNLRGVTTANKLGYLKRTTGGHGWNEGAYSARAITKVGDETRGISADCMRRDRRLMFGLSHRPWVNHDFRTIDFAIDCDPGNRWSKPSIYVVESGSRKKTLAPLVPGETAQIALNDDGFIAYYVDGELKYTSTKRPSFPLYADASLGTHHAELANARWVQKIVQGANNLQFMDFEALDGVNASAGHVKRTKEGTGWNSGATSKRAMTKVDDEVAGISADCDQTDKSMMLGLNSGSTNDVDSEIDFGIVCDNGMIRISEHGVVRDEDFGSYYPGETFQVSVLASGVVAYYKDGAQFSTSKHSPAFPLYATVRFNSHGASLSRVNWVKKIVEGGNDLQLVKWTNLRGVTTANKLGYLKRTTGGHGWNEGAYSARAITKVGDEIRGISADCMRRDRRLMFGLSHRPWVNHDFRTIDFAIDCDPGNRWSKPSIYVVESGSRKKTLAPLVPGETAQIALNDDGFIAYYVDGELKYTSTKRPSFPLYADASLGTHHAELANARWVQKIVQGANNLQFMDFEALDGVNASAGHVKRTKEGTGWNSGATSKRAMTKVDDEVAGISADCDQTDKSMMLGLNSGSTNDVDSEIDFGIVCDNGMIRISEHGVVRDEDFGSYYPGETFQVSVLASGVVAYYKDGAQFSTSKHSPAFPLYATVRFNSHGASLSRVNWVKKIVEGGNDLQLVKWTNLRGVTTANKLGYLKRTTGGHGWNEGAYSARAITKVGDEIRGISADCMRRDRRLMFGLSHRPWVNHDFRTIDFAIDCDPGNRWSKPSIYVVESGSRKKTLAPLVPGETAQIALNDDGFIAYYVDGELKYTSTKRPSFPLYADASLGTHHAELANARWVQKIVQGANNLQFMDFEALDGVNASAGHVKRTKEGTGWNSGATSKRAMTKVDDEVAGISADCDQTDKSMMLGLNSGSTNDVDSEIDFGIVCDNGMIRISEHGVVRDEDFGSYYPGETFQVSVLASGVVAYYKDGAQFSTSKHSPAFPLYATVRFNSHGASLSRVNWVKKIVEGGNDLQLVKWTNLRGVTTANKLGYLKRTTGGHGWNEGAYSARAITKVGDEIRGISADCMRRDRRLMFGLSHRPWVNHDFRTIDFAIDCDPGNRWSKPSIYVVESGSRKKTLAPLVPGETAQIALNDDGFIAYYVDGELKYTSTKRPSFPLYADASLGTHHAELANVMWVANVASPTVVAQ